ncbi:MAG: hypothetical protein Q4C96_10775 [Planctomycetia bacterium]|nr:hypothetical protein [Planctomycetia bacterium]
MKIGIYYPDWGTSSLDAYPVLVLAEILSETHTVEMIHHHSEFMPKIYEDFWHVDLSRVTSRPLPPVQRINWDTWRPLRRLRLEYDSHQEISAPYDFFLAAGSTPPVFSHAKKSVLWIPFPRVNFSTFYGHLDSSWSQQNFFQRFFRKRYQKFEWRARFGSYQDFLCPSRFIKTCVKERWPVTARNISPPVPECIHPDEKYQEILTLGTISSENRNRHDVILACFKMLCDTHSALLKNWRLKIFADCDLSISRNQEFLEMLQDKSKDYPVDFHINPDAAAIQNAIRRAAFLWHARGYEAVQQKTPEFVEYSPMLPLMCMGAETIPLVFHAGSMAEVVHHFKDGFLWSTVQELIMTTAEIIKNVDAIPVMRRQCIQSAKKYDRETFRQNITAALKGIL